MQIFDCVVSADRWMCVNVSVSVLLISCLMSPCNSEDIKCKQEKESFSKYQSGMHADTYPDGPLNHGCSQQFSHDS